MFSQGDNVCEVNGVRILLQDGCIWLQGCAIQVNIGLHRRRLHVLTKPHGHTRLVVQDGTSIRPDIVTSKAMLR